MKTFFSPILGFQFPSLVPLFGILGALGVLAVLGGLGVAIGGTTASAADPEFHLYLLVGQSNMAGRGPVDEESKVIHPRVMMLTKDLQWVPATDPLHFDKPAAAVGPGLVFGKTLAEASPKVKVGLVPCAVGGSSIKAWVPGALDKATNTHPYDDMLKRMQEALKTGVLKGIIWHQGESDRGASDQYASELTALIERLRTDLGVANVPFVAGELTSFKPSDAPNNKKFNDAVNGLAKEVRNYGCVSSEGLHDKGDLLHYNAQSARELGKRYAKKMMELQAR